VLIVQHDRNETVDGVEIIGLPRPRDRFQRIFGLAFRVLHLALKEKADVYHFHDPELIPVGLFLKFLGAKVVYDVHECYPASIKKNEWLPPFMRNVVAGIFDLFEKICHCFFDAIVTATEDIARRFRSDKAVVIHNYPILNYAIGRADHRSLNEDHTAIYAGALSRTRGISEIVRSLGYIDKGSKVRLKLLGMFTEPDFEEEVRNIKCFSKVDFIGLVPHEEVYSHLLSAEIGLVVLHPTPGYITSMPIKMFEYMAAELPIIASDFPLWKEIVEGNNCGLTVDPMKPQKIAEAIEYLLERSELMKRMGENGRKAVLEKHNWEQETKKLLAVYTKVLDSEVGRSQDVRKGLPEK
jgi:glycosyltransferase involved in cell wall biosynthesis